MGGRSKEKGYGERNQKPNNPLSLFLTPKSFQEPDLGVEKGVLVGEGDVKATDFLTSRVARAPHLQSLGARAGGEMGKG